MPLHRWLGWISVPLLLAAVVSHRRAAHDAFSWFFLTGMALSVASRILGRRAEA